MIHRLRILVGGILDHRQAGRSSPDEILAEYLAETKYWSSVLNTEHWLST